MRIPKRLMLVAGVAALSARRALKAPYDLGGKVALISGGSRGLGLALARELVARGAKVSLLARDGAELDRAAQDIRGRGGEAYTVVADVTQPADLTRAVAETVAHFGRLDIVVNNAGIIQTGPLENMTDEDFVRIMEVNAFGALRLTRAALPHLKKNAGRVLIVSSVGGKVAVPHLGPYSVSKFASYGLGQALRAELAQHGVGVTTVLPSLMRTGSARQAEVKGQYEKEYALFATLDNLPVLSLDAAVAARRAVDALVRGNAQAMIGGPALLLGWASNLAPELTADLMALTTRFLPAATASDAARPGKQVETEATRNNPIKGQAEREFNQK
ncbi:SDR family oxidoreductase [Deinococcus cavernae]|uniref:SDR family oxidoreductase n=1 Tax=Deinococcus cavernae TaxID=2320857 RepID=A0A418UZX2_9DEIO|nr:SDR family oxidoreductase [Deinococcus cavernae]RJF69002.1 SDR family oxidoreductase [Deinococcus cavernae]